MRREAPERGSPDWRHYRRVLAVVAAVAVVTAAAALAVLHDQGVVLRPHFVVAITLAITVSLLLAGALMGLVFASARSGHDDAVERPTNDKGRPKGRP